MEDEEERHLRMREAKTRADEIVQEILLQSVLPEYQAVLSWMWRRIRQAAPAF